MWTAWREGGSWWSGGKRDGRQGKLAEWERAIDDVQARERARAREATSDAEDRHRPLTRGRLRADGQSHLLCGAHHLGSHLRSPRSGSFPLLACRCSTRHTPPVPSSEPSPDARKTLPAAHLVLSSSLRALPFPPLSSRPHPPHPSLTDPCIVAVGCARRPQSTSSDPSVISPYCPFGNPSRS